MIWIMSFQLPIWRIWTLRNYFYRQRNRERINVRITTLEYMMNIGTHIKKMLLNLEMEKPKKKEKFLQSLQSMKILNVFFVLQKNWFHSFHRACQGRSRYYAITEGCRMMNLLGAVFNMYGLMRPPLVFR